MMTSASDNRVTSRLTKVISDIKNFDRTSVHGKRVVRIGLPDGKVVIKGFNFNKRSILGGVLFKPFAIDAGTGEITITDLVPMNDIKFPAGTTHLSAKEKLK